MGKRRRGVGERRRGVGERRRLPSVPPPKYPFGILKLFWMSQNTTLTVRYKHRALIVMFMLVRSNYRLSLLQDNCNIIYFK